MASTRMYILVRDRIPPGIVAVSLAHAGLSCYLQFKDDPHVQKWLQESYRKCVVKVTDEQFLAAHKEVPRTVLISESGYGGVEVALVCAPRPSKKWPRWFNILPLWDTPLQEGDWVEVINREPGTSGGAVGTVDALQGYQDRPESVRVQIARDCEWFAPHEIRRLTTDPTPLKLGLPTDRLSADEAA